VKKVEAWKSRTGTLFSTMLGATVDDLKSLLHNNSYSSVDTFTEGQARRIIAERIKVVALLKEYDDHMEASVQ